MFIKSDPQLFFKNQKSHDKRLGEWAKNLDASFFEKATSDIKSENRNYIIAGYADDQGIKNNSGRLGARLAPDKIREFFYKMTPPYHYALDFENPEKSSYSIIDIGSLDEAHGDLEARHEYAQTCANKAFRKNFNWISLGGGHDYGYPDVSAFIKSCDDRPLVINFDAHLDVRSTEHGINSGTPFFRVLEEFQNVDLVQIGIQSQCNSNLHYKYSLDHGVKVLNYDDIRQSGESLASYSIRRMGDQIIKRRKCFISVDIDSFSNAYAPGCSQSFATGLHPDEFFQFFSILLQRLDVRGLGIYEVSPPLDIDNRTAKLAALIMHKYIFSI